MKGIVSLMVLAIVGAVGTAAAQGPEATGSVAGRVTDERGQALGGADVLVVGRSNLLARSAANGSYVLDGVPAGTHTLQARLIGYRSQTATVTVNPGARTTQDFMMRSDPLDLAAIVVTGVQSPRTKTETSTAITVLSPADITQASPRSTTEVLRYVPGFTRVESSGGEVNENISMRGILGVEYVMFMEDGLPVFPTMHTFFMNADNLFRMDENIARVEVVRGGSSALFGSNTPGAIINFINKTGGPENSGTMKVSGATEGLARYDFNLNGPMGDEWGFNVGGFYRYDHGVRNPGFPGIAGGQLKASLTRNLENGYVRFSGKVINDRNQFILPLPFQGPGEYVDGFSDYGSMNTNEGNHLRVPIPTGELELPLENGLRTRASWLTADVNFDLDRGWAVRNSTQLMSNEQEWNAILPFDVQPSANAVEDWIGNYFGSYYTDPLRARGVMPATADSVRRSVLPGSQYRLTYTNHRDALGNPIPFNTPNDLLAPGGEWHVEKPLTAFQNQLQIRKDLASGNSVSLGVYFANYTQTNRWFFTDILTDVRDNPRFVDLAVDAATIRYISFLPGGGVDTTDVAIADVQATSNGFRRYLSNYVNGSGTTTVVSGVVGAALRLTPRLRADLGFRYEWNDFVQSAENTSTVAVSDTVSETLFDVEPWGNGSFRHLKRDLGDWAASVGLNYSVSDDLAFYALGARAYKMPALDEFLVAAAQAQVDLFAPRRTYSFEGGAKYASGRYAVTVNGFFTQLKNIVGQGAVVDPGTGETVWEIRTSPENRSYGAEIEVSAIPGAGFTVLGTATFLKAELGSGAGADIGSWVNGVPPVIGNLAATYRTGALTLLGDWHYVGRRFVDVSAGNALEAYGYANLGASYTVPGEAMTIDVHLQNALQSKGFEEGNPRLQGARPLFLARPVLPRRLLASLRYEF